MRRTTGLAVLVLSLVAAAVALAAVPPKGKYTGQTSQGRSVHIRINKHHNIPDGGFVVHWLADNCKANPNASWGPEGSSNSGTIDVKSDGSFRRSGHYNSHVKGYTGHISISGKGQFTTKTQANGTFKVKVRVVKNSTGNQVDTCRASVTWSVVRALPGG